MVKSHSVCSIFKRFSHSYYMVMVLPFFEYSMQPSKIKAEVSVKSIKNSFLQHIAAHQGYGYLLFVFIKYSPNIVLSNYKCQADPNAAHQAYVLGWPRKNAGPPYLIILIYDFLAFIFLRIAFWIWFSKPLHVTLGLP